MRSWIPVAIVLAVLNAGCVSDVTEDVEPQGAPDAGGVMAKEQTFRGAWDLDDPRCAGPEGHGIGQAGITYAVLDIDPDTIGQSFRAAFTGSSLGTEVIEWYGDDGSYIGFEIDSGSGGPDEIKGDIPAGAATAHFFSCLGGDSVSYQTPA